MMNKSGDTRCMSRYIVLVLLAILTVSIVDAATVDSVSVHRDSLSEKAEKTLFVAMGTNSIIEDNLVVENGMKSESAIQLQMGQNDAESDSWFRLRNFFTTFIYPIVTLFIGVWIQDTMSSRADKRRSKKIGKRWIAELSAQYGEIENQIKSFDKFITEYCDNYNRFDIPNISYKFINGRNFDALGKEDLYDYLSRLSNRQNQTGEETYRKIIKIISSLDLIETQTRDHIQEFKNRTSTLVEAYNTNLVRYGKLLQRIPTENPSMSGSMTIHLKALHFIAVCSSMSSNNIFEYEDSFVKPSLEILKSNHFPEELDDVLQNCLSITQELRKEKSYIKSNLQSANAQYGKVLEKIGEINEICHLKHGWFYLQWQRLRGQV